MGFDCGHYTRKGKCVRIGIAAYENQSFVRVNCCKVLTRPCTVSLPLVVVIKIGLPTIGSPNDNIICFGRLTNEDFVCLLYTSDAADE